MANITIQKAPRVDALPRPIFEEMESTFKKVKAKAYELFLTRGGEPGHEVEDWLLAERQLMGLPDTELTEKEREFQARIQMQGLDAKEIRVIALPYSILLQAEPKSRETK